MLLIGSHVKYNNKTQLLGSVEEAISYGATTFMFYTGAPQNTLRTPIEMDIVAKAKELMHENGIEIDNVVVHAPYIINLANTEKYDFAVSFLKQEIKRCETIGIKYMVLHPGSHVGLGEEVGINNIINGLNDVLENSQVTILLETMAGKGSELGCNLDQIKTIIDNVSNKERIGICLDTCHLNDSGYDMNSFDKVLDEVDKKIGINYIGCVHINDSKNPINSHKDRHENIGYGTIGFDTLINIIYNDRLIDVPKILETPYIGDIAPYKEEIQMIKNRKFIDFKASIN
ncbi:MAG: deoxyribonuclease IV [Bacilli bacterium]|nr:deoxyribonuclease IV [Bacilli bacterium]